MDSCVVPHRSTNRAVLWLTAQIGRDAVLSESYGRRQQLTLLTRFLSIIKRQYLQKFFAQGRRDGWMDKNSSPEGRRDNK
jgi:hypothetical protein